MSLRIVDADAHVIETAETFSYLREDEKKYRPILLNPEEGDDIGTQDGARNKEYWLADKTLDANARAFYGLA